MALTITSSAAEVVAQGPTSGRHIKPLVVSATAISPITRTSIKKLAAISINSCYV